MPVVAHRLRATHQHHTQAPQALAQFEVFPTVEAEAGVEEAAALEHLAIDRHIARGEIGPGEVAQLVGLAGGILEVGRVDHGPVGEAKAIAAALPVVVEGAGVGEQEAFGHHQIAIDKDDHVALGMLNAPVTALGRAAVVLLDQPHMGERRRLSPQPGHGVIAGAVINDHHLVGTDRATQLLLLEGAQTFRQDRPAVVGGDNDAEKHGFVEAAEGARTPKKRGTPQDPHKTGHPLRGFRPAQSAAPPLLAVPVTPLPAPSPRPSLRSLRFLNLRA